MKCIYTILEMLLFLCEMFHMKYILCSISVPLVFQDQFQINFYHIPIGIAGLYGGAIIGSILFILTDPDFISFR